MANAMASSDRLRQYFDPRVVERGDLVAVSGSVTILRGGVDRTTAVVRGRLSYDTALTLTKNESRTALVASCTCAHAARALCKHTWATLRVAERRGFLARAAHAPTLAIFPGVQQARAVELRWRVDLAKSGYDVHVDLYERATNDWGEPTGFRLAARERRWAVPPRPLAELAASGLCDVVVAKGRAAEPLTYDQGGAFRIAVVITTSEAHDGESFPGLHVRGELRRGDEVHRFEDLAAITGTGHAFLGARALEVAPSRGFWCIARLTGGPVEISSDVVEPFLRDLLSYEQGLIVELPATFVVDRSAPRRVRVQVRRPVARPSARLLRVDVAFDYQDVRTSWRERRRVCFDKRSLRIVVREGEAEQRAIEELRRAGCRPPRPPYRDDLHLVVAAKQVLDLVTTLPAERFVVEAEGVPQRRASAHVDERRVERRLARSRPAGRVRRRARGGAGPAARGEARRAVRSPRRRQRRHPAGGLARTRRAPRAACQSRARPRPRARGSHRAALPFRTLAGAAARCRARDGSRAGVVEGAARGAARGAPARRHDAAEHGRPRVPR